jgi:transcriptional regulator with XRE-family HTH domain
MADEELSEEAKMIQDYRRDRGLTLRQLADALGVDIMTVWRWEHGRRTPPARLVELALLGLDTERHRASDA